MDLSAFKIFNCSCTPPAAKSARAVATLLRASFPARANLNARHTIPGLSCLLQHGPSHPCCSPPADLAAYIHIVRHAVMDRTRKDHELARAALEASCALLRYHRSFALWFDGTPGVSRLDVIVDLMCTFGWTVATLHDATPDVRRGLIGILMSGGTPECLGDILANEKELDAVRFGYVTLTHLATSLTTGSVEDDPAIVDFALALWQHGVPEKACAMLAAHYDNPPLAEAAVSVAFQSFVPFAALRGPQGSPMPTASQARPVCEALLRVVCQPGVSDGVRRRAILTLRLICNTDGDVSLQCLLWLLVSDDFVRFMPLLIAGPDTVETPDSQSVDSLQTFYRYSFNEQLDLYRELASRLLCAFCFLLGPEPGNVLDEASVSHLEGKLVQALRAVAPNGGADLPGFLFGPLLRTLPPLQRGQYAYVARLLGGVRNRTPNDALRQACTAFLGHASWVRTRCGNPACTTNQSSVGKLKICARCQVENYCDVACQKGDWPRHKKDCKKGTL